MMEEGFYWIQHNGRVHVAYISNGVAEDLETGLTCNGIWHLTQGATSATTERPR